MKLKEFYNKQNILITGVTGFIGKVFLLKLLLSLPNVGKVYVLMRSKKGMNPKQRLHQMLTSEPFISLSSNILKSQANNTNEQLETTVKQSNFDWKNKLIALEGDIQMEGCGLSDEANKLVCNEVTLLFNIAASVQFDSPIKTSLEDNYYGAKNVVCLAESLKKLISFVHVSTFYTNCNRKHIDERVQPLHMPHDKLAELIRAMPDEVSQNPQTLKVLLDGRPNSYVLTKAMAENLVADYANKLPVCIVRPSIVVPSVNDPFPGWVDSINGPMGLGALASVGILRAVDWNYHGVMDVVPVDYCVNVMLAAAERTVRLSKQTHIQQETETLLNNITSKKECNNNNVNTNEICVYNLTSGDAVPQTWGSVFEKLRAASLEAPPMKMLRIPIQPPKIERANPVQLQLGRISELLFAYFIDLLLLLFGQKKVLVRITSKLHKGYEILVFFMTNSFTSDMNNFLRAYDELDPEDKKEFSFDVHGVDLDKFYRDAYLGTRKVILREEPSSIPAAKTKMRILFCIEYLISFLFYGFFLSTAYRLSVGYIL